MRIDGEWLLCDDGVIRPVLHGEILAANGAWVEALLLVDTGADRTVFSLDILESLELRPTAAPLELGGVGGVTPSVALETQIRLRREDGSQVVFRGQYAAVTTLEALDMSVLGRDLTNYFAVLADRPGNVVCLLRASHQYVIKQE